MIERLKLENYQKMPWKNGLGSTFEIARNKPIQDDDFTWRISMADVDQDGEFSNFKGKQRIISVLSGNGVRLKLDDNTQVDVLEKDLFAYSGAQHVFCQLLGTAIRDLNLIYNADAVSPRMQWIKGSDVQIFVSTADIIILFNLIDNFVIDVDQEKYYLHKYESLKIINSNRIRKVSLPQSIMKECCLIELFLK